jgi:hypothetical protein
MISESAVAKKIAGGTDCGAAAYHQRRHECKMGQLGSRHLISDDRPPPSAAAPDPVATTNAWNDEDGFEHLMQFAREVFVDTQIAAQIAARALSEVDAVVQYRPQHAICESVIVFLMVLFGEIERDVGARRSGSPKAAVRSN